jgi:hypothetical protein
MIVGQLMEDKNGNKFISALIGFGLALMLRKACKGNNCVVIKGPNPKVVSKNYYRIGNECYRYTPNAVSC